MSQLAAVADKTGLDDVEPTRSRKWLVGSYLCALMVAFGFLASFDLEKRAFWGDEAYTVLMIGPGFHSLPEVFNRLEPNKIYSKSEIRSAFDISKREEIPVLGALQVLTTEEHRHVPLYFSLASLWCKILGTTTGVIRSLSVVFAVLQIPAMYWFCSALFRSRFAGCAAATLVAGSPFHLIYAQEARPYSLWALLIMVCSTLLVTAMRRNTSGNWIAYGVSLVAICYTHLLSFTLLAAQAAYVWTKESWNKSETWRRFLSCVAIATAVAVPWAIAGAVQYSQKPSNFTHIAVPLGHFARSWMENLALLFTTSQQFQLDSVVIAIELLAFTALMIRKDRSARNYLVPMILFSVAPLLIPDLVQGGQRSLALKYMTPAVIANIAAVAGTLTAGILSRAKWIKAACSILLLFLLSFEVCSAYSYYPDNANRKVPKEYVIAVQQLRQMSRPVMVIRCIGVLAKHKAIYGRPIAMCMAFAAPAETVFAYSANGEPPQMPAGISEALFVGWNGSDFRNNLPDCSATRVESDLWLVSKSSANSSAIILDAKPGSPDSESEDMSN